MTLLLDRDCSENFVTFLRPGLVTFGLGGPVAHSLRVTGLGWDLTTSLGVASTVTTLGLVDLHTFLLHLAVLVVCGGALLVIDGGALLEHLLLHHHHGKLTALLALHLLSLQSHKVNCGERERERKPQQ